MGKNRVSNGFRSPKTGIVLLKRIEWILETGSRKKRLILYDLYYETYETYTMRLMANARNVRPYYPYWQYTDLFIFRFVSLLCLHSTLRLLHTTRLILWDIYYKTYTMRLILWNLYYETYTTRLILWDKHIHIIFCHLNFPSSTRHYLLTVVMSFFVGRSYLWSGRRHLRNWPYGNFHWGLEVL